MSKPTGKELRTRIEAVYLAYNDRPNAVGALRWFAWKSRVTPQTVSRWVLSQGPISGPALALLEELERNINGKQ